MKIVKLEEQEVEEEEDEEERRKEFISVLAEQTVSILHALKM